MDLTLTSEQKMLQNVARDWLASRCPKSLVREMESDDRGYLPELWAEMAEQGWLGLVVPERYGGSDMTFLDLAILLEEMGRACLPGPYFSTAVLGVLTIMQAASEDQKKDLLAKISSGDLIVTLAAAESAGSWTGDAVSVQAIRSGGNFTLDGNELAVPDANVADIIITPAKTSAGTSLFLVDARSRGLTIAPLKTIAGDKQCDVAYKHVLVPETDVLGADGQAPAQLDAVLAQAAVAKCAEAVGGAQQALDMTVGYAKDRVQFGRPIGSLQVIQHYCAQMATDVDCSRLLTYQAAWRLSEGLPARNEAAIAKAFVGEAYRRITALAQQIHGAIGFTVEHDVQLYYRRAKTAEVLFGDVKHHKDIVAQELGLADR